MNLEAVAPLIEQIIKDSLSQKVYPFGFAKYKGLGNKVASGKLRDSVKVVPVEKNDRTILQIYMEEYGQWVQSGRLPNKGKVPISAIEQWIKDRKLQGRDKKGRFIKRRSFAFAIQTNIKKFGIRPSNFLDKSIDKIINDDRIIDLIGEAGYEELIDLIEGI